MSTTAVKQPVAPVPSEPMTVYEFARSAEYVDKRFEFIEGRHREERGNEAVHVGATESLRHRLEPMIPAGWRIREDKPVRIPDWTEPLPEIAVVRGDYTIYRVRHPEPADIGMIVEASDTSLARDRGEKCDNYVKANLPVYWIVNLVDRHIEVYSAPAVGGYTSNMSISPERIFL